MDHSHGQAASERPIPAPLSRSFTGMFGRMFRELPPWEPDGKDDGEKIKTIEKLAMSMVAENPDPETKDFPAGYTFFGQFIDHDITFDPRSSLQRANDPDNLEDFRSPAFDLDCVYGRGPDDQPYMYEKLPNESDRTKLLISKNGKDLLRIGKTAVIGDMRNDENLIVSQLQLVFIKFHNKVNDDLKAKFPDMAAVDRFSEAQRIVRWHYQWVVIHDWLERLCEKPFVNKILNDPACPGKPKLCYYHYRDFPFMPVEFSVAAYRLAHSTMRDKYTLNKKFADVPLFEPEGTKNPNDLRGFQEVPAEKAIEWCHFLKFKGKESKTQMMQKIDPFLCVPVTRMPDDIAGPVPTPGTMMPTPPKTYHPDYIGRSLAFRNLLRAFRLRLPSGQSVARKIGVPLLKGEKQELPLWLYMLKEASAAPSNGERLGEVGRRITAETFIGLLAGDPSSYYSTYPTWTPATETAIKIKAEKPGNFQLRDIIAYAAPESI